MLKYFSICLVFICSLSQAQTCRYYQKIFTTISKQANVTYATAPGIPSVYTSESLTSSQNLTCDIFTPNSDTAAARALIIFAHSGGFINGSKDNQDMQALCDSFAKMGYVTTTINYRKNYNIFSSSSAERAVWRGTQDASSAVRFFKQNATTYKIDTSKIFFWGSSAGAFMALNLAYMDDNERPASITTTPNLGCKNCSGIATPNHDESIAGIISCWGAIGDTNWINNNNNTSAIMFHGTTDNSVSYNRASPFGLSTLPPTSGSNHINMRMNKTTIYHEMYPALNQPHEYWGTSNGAFNAGGPSAYWQSIIDGAKQFMIYKMGLPTSCSILSTSENYLQLYSNNNINKIICNNCNITNANQFVLEMSYDSKEWQTLESTNPSKNRNYFHNTVGINRTIYYRLKIIQFNGNVTYSNIVEYKNVGKNAQHIVYPNPAKTSIQIQSDQEIASIIIFNTIGATVQKLDNLATKNKLINTAALSNGLYHIKCVLQNGIQFIDKIVVHK